MCILFKKYVALHSCCPPPLTFHHSCPALPHVDMKRVVIVPVACLLILWTGVGLPPKQVYVLHYMELH